MTVSPRIQIHHIRKTNIHALQSHLQDTRNPQSIVIVGSPALMDPKIQAELIPLELNPLNRPNIATEEEIEDAQDSSPRELPAPAVLFNLDMKYVPELFLPKDLTLLNMKIIQIQILM
ncbi:hypothetical protein CRE_13756 [Caenorhabditis remanei]|uniref:Uncharacterized protein n=1 Tax=Caenorhabditis remanei TaxID=31234 RepID=E3NH68_CAERE|nr:hypothetical protein CRE_13756 [Caenorhabditis remanei]